MRVLDRAMLERLGAALTQQQADLVEYLKSL